MENALLIHGGALGDLVMSLRIVAALSEAGAAIVTVLGKPEIATIAVPDGGIDAVLDMNHGGYHALFAAEATLPPRVASILRRFDIAVDMLGGPGSVSCARLKEAGIARVIGLDPRPRPDWAGHITEQWLTDLRAAGLDAQPGPPAIELREDRRAEARRRLREIAGSSDARVAVLHPGSGSRNKCWPPDRFAESARHLQATGWRVVILLGPVEQERFAPGEIAALRAAGPTISDRPLREVVDILAGADLVIGNDSGISHLAAALDTPTIAIFGPTNPKLWGPMGRQATLVHPEQRGQWPSVEEVANAVPAGPT